MSDKSNADLLRIVECMTQLKADLPQTRAASSKHLFELAKERPGLMLTYLDSLPKETEEKVPTLSTLRSLAKEALVSHAKASLL